MVQSFSILQALNISGYKQGDAHITVKKVVMQVEQDTVKWETKQFAPGPEGTQKTHQSSTRGDTDQGRCYQSKAKIANLFLKMGWNKLKKWPLEVEHLLQSWKKSPDSSALTAKSSRTPPRCISFAKMNLVRLLCLSWTNLDSRWCRGRYSWHRWLLSEEDMCPIAAVVETFLAQQEDGRGYEVDLDGLWALKAIWDKMFRKEM